MKKCVNCDLPTEYFYYTLTFDSGLCKNCYLEMYDWAIEENPGMWITISNNKVQNWLKNEAIKRSINIWKKNS